LAFLGRSIDGHSKTYPRQIAERMTKTGMVGNGP
jgi:hypothetical protein